MGDVAPESFVLNKKAVLNSNCFVDFTVRNHIRATFYHKRTFNLNLICLFYFPQEVKKKQENEISVPFTAGKFSVH